MQMRFSQQITLSLSPIPFINVMISKTIFNLFSIAINIILFPISLFGYWISFSPLHSSLDNGWRMIIRRCFHKVIVCPNILSLVTVCSLYMLMSSSNLPPYTLANDLYVLRGPSITDSMKKSSSNTKWFWKEV